MTKYQLAALDRAEQETRAAFDENGECFMAYLDASAAFSDALVNAYRTGKLVLIDDGAVERVAEALCHDAGCVWDFDPETDSRKEWRSAATAALSAMGVK